MSLCYKIREEVDAAWTKEGLIVMRRPGTDGYDPKRKLGASAFGWVRIGQPNIFRSTVRKNVGSDNSDGIA